MIQQLNRIDDLIRFQIGTIMIVLQWVATDAYTVTTTRGGILRIEDNCGSYPTEDEARAIARGYAQMYKAEHEAPATLDSFRQPHRATPPRSQVHRKPLTPAERARIAANVDGVVKVRPGQPWTMLRAIHQRIGGERTYKPGSKHIIASLTLSAEQLGAVA